MYLCKSSKIKSNLNTYTIIIKTFTVYAEDATNYFDHFCPLSTWATLSWARVNQKPNQVKLVQNLNHKMKPKWDSGRVRTCLTHSLDNLKELEFLSYFTNHFCDDPYTVIEYYRQVNSFYRIFYDGFLYFHFYIMFQNWSNVFLGN